MKQERKLSRSIQNTAWTGMVTAFYCEYCNRIGLVDFPDAARDVLVRRLKEQLKKEHLNPYRILTPEKLEQRQLINVAVRKKQIDRIMYQIFEKKKPDSIVNMGCGFDTRGQRITDFDGLFIDIDLPEVIYWKRKYLEETPHYRMYGTEKAFIPGFFEKLRKHTNGKILLVCEGLFCYFSYSEIISFVNGFFQSYPDGMLLCDCFLFEETFRFSDDVSRFMLAHPVLERYGTLYGRVNNLFHSIIKDNEEIKEEGQTPELMDGLMITEASRSVEGEKLDYFVSCYEKKADDPEVFRLQLRDQRDAMVELGSYELAKTSNEELMNLEISLKKSKVLYYPTSLQIEHTDRCNAACIMCSHYFTRNHGTGFCDEELFSVLDEILPSVRTVTMQGMGEPFLHPRINDLIRHYGLFGIRMNCSTNASIMNKELALLVEKYFYDINISCDACTAEVYENIRKGLSFERFQRNVRLLREVAPELKMKLAVVVMRQNIRELPGIIDMAANLGFSQVTVMDVTTQTLLENDADSLKNYPAAAEYYILQAMETAKERKIACSFPNYLLRRKKTRSLEEELKLMDMIPFHSDSFADELYQRYEKSGFYKPLIDADLRNFAISGDYHVNGFCRLAAARPFIDLNGNVFLCCNSWMHVVGNIYRDGSFDAVWNGSVMVRIRELFYEGKLPKYCEGCIFLRDEMFAGIQVTDADSAFYRHNYDEEMTKLLGKVENGS